MPRSESKRQWSKGKKLPRAKSVRRFLILCEDTKSSRDYLSCFPYNASQVEIDCVGTGMNTDSLMEEAVKRRTRAMAGNEPYEEIWVVFDRDSFPPHHFNRAFELAASYNDVVPCWSNECFELWYLLHFVYRNTPIDRSRIKEDLRPYLGFDYDKADKKLYDFLKDMLPTALRNSMKLAYPNIELGDIHDNPSTRVHELVILLQSFDPGDQ